MGLHCGFPKMIGTALATVLLATLVAASPAPAEEPDRRTLVRWSEEGAISRLQPMGALDARAKEVLAVWTTVSPETGRPQLAGQRFDMDLRKLGAEIVIARELTHQPDVVLDSGGGAWVAYVADRDRPEVVVHSISSDRRVAERTALVGQPGGLPSFPSLVAGPRGVLVAWSERVGGGVFASRVDQPAGVFQVNTESDLLAGSSSSDSSSSDSSSSDSSSSDSSSSDSSFKGRTRHVSVTYLPSRNVYLAVWARHLPDGGSAGLHARFLDGDGRPMEPRQILVDANDVHGAPIEPHVEATVDGFVLTWMALGHKGYAAAARRFDAHGHSATAPWTWRDTESWLSGARAAVSPTGQLAFFTNRGLDGRSAITGVLAEDRNSAMPRLRLSDPRRPVERLAVMTSGRQAAWLGDDRLVFLTHTEVGKDHTLDVAAVTTATAAMDTLEAAGPYEQTTALSTPPPPPSSVAPRAAEEADFGFLAHDHPGPRFSGFSGDVTLGVGPEHFVAAVNLRIRFFTKDGRMTYDADIHQFFNQFATRPATIFSGEPQIWDPKVRFDPFSRRFIVSCLYTDQSLLFAVSDDADPNGDWAFGRQDTSSFNTFTDAPNLGFTDDAFFITPQFVENPVGVWAFVLDKARVLRDNPNFQFEARLVDPGQATLSSGTRTYDPGAPYYWVRYRRPLRNPFHIQAVTGPPSNPVIHEFTLPAPRWTFMGSVPQGGSSLRLRIPASQPVHNSILRNGSLWFAHTIRAPSGADQSIIRWFEVTMNGWPESGNEPVLVQVGDINLGTTPGGHLLSAFTVNLDVDADNNVGFVFSGSAQDQMATIYRALRHADDPPGTVQGIKEWIRSTSPGTTLYSDYSGMQIDPADPHRVWGHAEYFVDTWEWETWIAGFQISAASDPPPAAGPEITLDHLKRNFGEVRLGASAFPRRVTVVNDGTEDLELSAIVVRGANRTQFHLLEDGCSNKALAPGKRCTFRVGFEPTRLELQRAMAILRSNDPDEGEIRVVLRGTGVP